MACSQYEYVKKFETYQTLLPNTYIVVRIDGKGFTKFTANHNFEKPNDKRGLDLMNKAAESVMETFNEIMLAYGQSDEFSFVFKKDAELYQRRTEKIVSCLVSCFTAAYAMHFSDYFNVKPSFLPMFDARAVCYPDFKNLRDYLNWRQVDCHINNLYNTCFWTMVQKGNMTPQKAQEILKDTLSDRKNEILFNDYGINYAKLEPQFRKGSTLIRVLVLKDKHANKKGENLGQAESLEKTEKSEENEGSNKEASQLNKEGEEEKENASEPSKEESDSVLTKGEKKYIAGQKKQKKLNSKQLEKIEKSKYRSKIITLSDDIIQNEFWDKYKDSLKLQE
ncbi:hypothetical protein ABPG74_022531 [Tetrahymena malaccensis]